jgi:hypothetical protein
MHVISRCQNGYNKKARKYTQESDRQTDECMHLLLRAKISLLMGRGAYVYMHLEV